MSAIPPIIFWAAVSMLALGVVFGIGLVLAARAFRVQEDERVREVEEVLPAINCGGCGYAGCHAYAEAVVEGEGVTLCTAGGPDVAAALAAIMGVEISDVHTLRAVVHCQGGTSRCGDRFEYVGEQDCRAAHITSGGPKKCIYGCLGFGSCAEACPYDAIAMNEERLPVIDPDKCTACGICVRACPLDLISLLPVEYKTYLGCSSHDRAKAVKDVCSVGCIACGLCVRKDPHEATELVDNLPVLDFEKAGGDFRTGAEVCPMNSFTVEAEAEAPLQVAAAGEAEEA
ncbi:MAG: RnfABCDGE type electron transport complex subunit B [Planctomycetota bacterium]|jgi:RnfABCDGE-type electron transport complex B subunit